MYDMYHWDSSVPATEDTGSASRPAASRPAAAVRAVQVALDRRDNGGDASGGEVGSQVGRGGGAGNQ